MTRDRWIKSFVEQNKVIELVEYKGNVYLYVTHSKDYDGRASMYHVWNGDQWVFAGTNYRQACEVFEGSIEDEDDKQTAV